MSRSHTHREKNNVSANLNTTTAAAATSNSNTNTNNNTSTLPERVEDTLAHLLIQFLPQTDGASAGRGRDGKGKEQLEQEADDRFYAAFERAVGILEGSGGGDGGAGAGAGAGEEDVNGSGDLIKKKLIRENNSPEKALRFSTLYSRLLTQNVLTRKWAMLYFLYKLSDSDVTGAAAYGHHPRRRQDYHQQQQRQSRQQEERHRHRALAQRPGTATSAASASGALTSPSSSDGYRLDGDARSAAASPTVTSSRLAAGGKLVTTTTTTSSGSRMAKAKLGREFVVDSATFNDAFSEAEPGALASADPAGAGTGVGGLRVRSPMTGQRPLSSASAWSARSGFGGGGVGGSGAGLGRRRDGRSARADRTPRSRPDLDDVDLGEEDVNDEDGVESVRREIRNSRYKRTTTTTAQLYRSRRRVNGAGTGTEADSDLDSEATADDDYRDHRQRNQRQQRKQYGGGEDDNDDNEPQIQFRIMSPSEPTLLRGLPNMLQGLPTEHVSFVYEPGTDASKNDGGGRAQICLPSTLSAPTISLLHHLAEPALLYRELDAFTEGPSSDPSSSSSLRSGSASLIGGSGLGGDSGARSSHTRRKDHHHSRQQHHHMAKDGGRNPDRADGNGGGLVGQSLRAAIGSELRKYLDLVADLEKKIRGALVAAGDAGDDNDGDYVEGYDERKIKRMRKAQREQVARIAEAGVTLKKCVVLMRDATLRLRLMSAIVYACRGKKGGELISTIHSFSITNGDPFVCLFAEKLLSHVTQPFYDMLRHWIYDGELSDPFLEFFVSENASEEGSVVGGGDARKGGATSVWEDKYKLNAKMIPTIVTEEFANKVFLIGKSLNFIRYGCGDGSWVELYSKEASRELRYGDTASLETSIGEAYKTTMARLITLMADKFKLFVHLEALKKYLLLGAGDFIAVLMESLAPNLDRPANTQYRHTLTAQLEHAVRNSNAQHEPADVLGRLDSRMLELSHGEIGWDVFTLEYKVGQPVDVVVTPAAARQYLRVFNFLWRVKRVDFALASTWRRCMTGARGVLGSIANANNNSHHKHGKDTTGLANDNGGGGGGKAAAAAAAQPSLASDWKCARACIAEMIHLVAQLQYYILFEVIEASWAELQAAIRQPECTLDGLITAHARYLTRITRKGLLGSSSSSSSSSLNNRHDRAATATSKSTDANSNANVITGAGAGARSGNATTTTPAGPSQSSTFPSSSSSPPSNTPDFPAQLHELLKTMLAYRDAVDGLYSFSVADFTRRQERSARLETDHYRHLQHQLISNDHHDLPGPGPLNNNSKTNMMKNPTGLETGFGVEAGGGGGGGGKEEEEEDPMLPALRTRLAGLATDFRSRVHVLLGDLYAQPDPDLRWLAMVMNFNDFYGHHHRVGRHGRGRERERERERERGGKSHGRDGGGGVGAAGATAGVKEKEKTNEKKERVEG